MKLEIQGMSNPTKTRIFENGKEVTYVKKAVVVIEVDHPTIVTIDRYKSDELGNLKVIKKQDCSEVETESVTYITENFSMRF